jgi:hypothetical protein
MNWFEQALADIGAAVEDAVEAVGEVVEDVVEAVGGVVEDVVDAVGDVIEDVGEAFEDAGEAIVDAAEDFGEFVEEAVDWTMNVLDDTVFEVVDFVTFGAVDLSYEDGQFSADLDFGIASVGISVGDAGFSAEAGFDVGLASGEISFDSATGLEASGSIGVDWGPLPYAEGHLSIGRDGSVSIGGEIQATLPLPGGGLSFETSGGFERNPDGSWGAFSDTSLDGDTVFGGFHLGTDSSLEGDRSGVRFESGFEAEASGPLGAHAGVEGNVRAGFTDGVLSAGADIAAEAGALDVDVRGAASLAGSAGRDGTLDLSADASAGATIGDRAVDAAVGLGRSVDESGVITDVLTGEVVATDAGVTVGSIGGSITGQHGAVPPTVSADGWVDVVGDADPGLPAGSSASALQPADTSTPPLVVDALVDVPVDAFIEAGVEPVEAFVEPAPAPEAPPADDFSVDIAAIESVEAQADDIWDDVAP